MVIYKDRAWGKKSKKFFEYLHKYNLDIGDLDSDKMLRISADTGLKYGYVKKLKSRYFGSKDKIVPVTHDDIIFVIDKFNDEYDGEIPGGSYDVFSNIKHGHKIVMCKYLKELLGRDVSVSTFDRTRNA